MTWSDPAWVFLIRMGCVTILSPLWLGKVVPSCALDTPMQCSFVHLWLQCVYYLFFAFAS
jgi:hypothetical protein